MTKLKYFLPLLTLIISLSSNLNAQTLIEELEWFEGYFKKDKITNVDESIAAANSKIIDAQEAFDKLGEAQAIKELGLLYLTQTFEYEKAMSAFLEALAFEENNNLEDGKVFTYLAIAKVFETVEIHYKSADFLNKALLLSEVENNVHLKVYLLIQLGRINTLMNELQLANESFEAVLALKGKVDLKYEAEANFRIGKIEKLKGNYIESLEIHKKALNLQRKLNDRYNEGISLYAIGQLYWAMNNKERALANYVAAIEVQSETKDNTGLAKTYVNIGSLYFDIKNYERSISNLELSLQRARSENMPEIIRECHLKLSQCYRQLNKYERALEYQEQFLAINEFIENDKDEQELVKIQNRHNIEDFESKIKTLGEEKILKEKELAEQLAFRKNLLILTTFILVIAVLLLILYFVKRQSNKKLTMVNRRVAQQNEELHDLNATKDKFFSIISHDLKGPLNSLSSFTYLLTDHIESMSKDEIQSLAKDLDKSQKNLYALLENLLEWSQSQTGKIEFTPEEFNIVELIKNNTELLSAQAQNKNITLATNIQEETETVFANKNAVNTVTRNLISNAIKFTPAEGSIILSLKKAEKEIIVSVKDTGVGMSQAVMQKLFRIDAKHSTKGTADEKGTGLGLILCKEFIEKSGGKIWVESEIDKGSVFSFSVPTTK